VAEGGGLDPAPHTVDAPVRHPHDVERVGDAAGVVEMRGQSGPVRLGQSGGHRWNTFLSFLATSSEFSNRVSGGSGSVDGAICN
jgi:hypothetical protein